MNQNIGEVVIILMLFKSKWIPIVMTLILREQEREGAKSQIVSAPAVY